MCAQMVSPRMAILVAELWCLASCYRIEVHEMHLDSTEHVHGLSSAGALAADERWFGSRSSARPFAMEEAMVRLADGIYSHDPQVGEWSLMVNWTGTGFGLVNGTDRVAIYQKGDQCGVAFAGSDDLQDWIDDFVGSVDTKNLSACGLEGVHMGIFEEMQQFILSPEWSRDFVPYLDAHCTGGISTTGHSLGGGLASLVAACSNNVGSSVFVPDFVKWGTLHLEGREVRMPTQAFSMYTIAAPALTKGELVNGMAPNGVFGGTRSYNLDRFSQDWAPTVGQLIGFQHPKVSALGLQAHWGSDSVTFTRDRGHVNTTTSLPVFVDVWNGHYRAPNPELHLTKHYVDRLTWLNNPRVVGQDEEFENVEAPVAPSESELRESADTHWDFSDLPSEASFEEDLVRLVSEFEIAQTVTSWTLELRWSGVRPSTIGFDRSWNVALYKNDVNDCILAIPGESGLFDASMDFVAVLQSKSLPECGLNEVQAGLFDRFHALVASPEWQHDFVPFIDDHCQGSVIAAGHGTGGAIASILATCANAVSGSVEDLADHTGGAVSMPRIGFSALYTFGAPGASKEQLVNSRSSNGRFAGSRFFLNDALAQDLLPPSGYLLGYVHPKVGAVRLRRSLDLLGDGTYIREEYEAESDAARTYPQVGRQPVTWYHNTWYYARGIRHVSFQAHTTTSAPSPALEINASACEWRDDRFIGHDRPVDNTTMACWSAGLRLVCTCRYPGDCYVSKSLRPEPQDLKRCFTPVAGS